MHSKDEGFQSGADDRRAEPHEGDVMLAVYFFSDEHFVTFAEFRGAENNDPLMCSDRSLATEVDTGVSEWL